MMLVGVVAGLGAALLRGILAPVFATPRTSTAIMVHRKCRLVSGEHNALVVGSAPSIVSGVSTRGNVAAHFKVTLQTPDGEQSFECPDDIYILDQSEVEGLRLPFSCRTGTCASCAGKVLSGSIDQSEQAFLQEDQMEKGYCLTCVTLPLSDVTIKTHCEEEL